MKVLLSISLALLASACGGSTLTKEGQAALARAEQTLAAPPNDAVCARAYALADAYSQDPAMAGPLATVNRTIARCSAGAVGGTR